MNVQGLRVAAFEELGDALSPGEKINAQGSRDLEKFLQARINALSSSAKAL
jgi:hypothetical protein